MYTKYLIRDGSLVKGDEENVWIVWKPTDEETRLVREKCDIDEYDIQSAMDADEVPRLEVESDRYTIIWKEPTQAQPTETSLFAVSSIGLFFDKTRLVVIAGSEPSLMERKHQRKVESLEDVRGPVDLPGAEVHQPGWAAVGVETACTPIGLNVAAISGVVRARSLNRGPFGMQKRLVGAR